MTWNDDTITPKMILDHMQNSFQCLRTEFKREFRQLKSEMRQGFADIHQRLDWYDSHDLPKRVSDLEDKIFAGIDPE